VYLVLLPHHQTVLLLSLMLGNAGAQATLGVFYEQGIHGLTKSSKRAIEYYTLAANQGYPEAQFNLGAMYVNGDDIETSADNYGSCNYSKAREWLTKAAAQGDENAINALKQLDEAGV